ncbi:hypothetical protein [Bacillus cereus]|uniref:Uncharacterized protein n=1 Tax=Bacillus cereus TaxID=1396 RepID=A0A162P4M3_BACCE|nr:hypothetical protein [Bacillus cereus]KZD66353.1 hypothetical protein B4088_2469 [Bacillus cereus]
MQSIRNYFSAAFILLGLLFISSPAFAAGELISITISPSSTSSYDTEPYPTVNCVAKYNINNQVGQSCNSKMKISSNTVAKDGTRTICYAYSEAGKSDEKCIKRYYAKSAEVSGSDTSHTGDHLRYVCSVTYTNGVKKDFTTSNVSWKSAPFSYIGNEFYANGYGEFTKSNGANSRVYATPNAINEFYPGDTNSNTYTIYCNPTTYTEAGLGEKASAISGSKKITHHGISNMELRVKGWFADNNGNLKEQTIVSKNNKAIPKTFVGGQRYDFAVYATFGDGTTKEISASNDLVWRSKINGSTSLEASKHGYSYMIPATPEHEMIKTVSVFEWAPYTSPAKSNNTDDYILELPLRKHNIHSIEIRGASLQDPAKTTVNPRSNVKYTAWVRWSDEKITSDSLGGREQAQRQDWTQMINWEGEYATSTKGTYQFNSSGKTTNVIARFKRPTTGVAAGPDIVTSINVAILPNVSCDADKLTAGCSRTTEDWQTQTSGSFGNISGGFDNLSNVVRENSNYLPPPSVMGVDKWTDENNPYYFGYKFPVSGINGGVSNR